MIDQDNMGNLEVNQHNIYSPFEDIITKPSEGEVSQTSQIYADTLNNVQISSIKILGSY